MRPFIDRIRRDEAICGGEPIIQGTRITVRDVVEYMALYGSEERVLQALPDLTLEDLRAALEYFRAHREEIDRYRQAEEESERWTTFPMSSDPRPPECPFLGFTSCAIPFQANSITRRFPLTRALILQPFFAPMDASHSLGTRITAPRAPTLVT